MGGTRSFMILHTVFESSDKMGDVHHRQTGGLFSTHGNSRET